MDSKISKLVAGQICDYNDELYSLALTGLAQSGRIPLPTRKAHAESQSPPPSAKLGMCLADVAAIEDLQSRQLTSGVRLENISAADSAVGDLEFVEQVANIRLFPRRVISHRST